ncbi:MAG: DUF3048 domain-containing protein, partial [Actinomycetota bacterium]
VPVICPLTGVETSKEFDIDRPALGVKIENSTKSRPQAGLEHADIVYEELAEGGVTRFLAMFHCSDADPLGPVRSARMVDPDILLEYAPVLFAFSGGNPLVKEKISRTPGITALRHGNHGEAYRREKGRPAPSDLFSTTQKLRELSDASSVRGAPKSGLILKAAEPLPAGAAVTATVQFDYSGKTNAVKYTFDAASNSYLRSHGETPHVSVTGAQLSATNVVLLKVRVTQGTIRDAAGNFSPEIAVVGEGEAVVVYAGRSFTGTWKRPSLSAKTQLFDATGRPITLIPGRTWIHLIPQERKVTLS